MTYKASIAAAIAMSILFAGCSRERARKLTASTGESDVPVDLRLPTVPDSIPEKTADLPAPIESNDAPRATPSDPLPVNDAGETVDTVVMVDGFVAAINCERFPLHCAAKEGNIGAILAMMNEGTNPNEIEPSLQLSPLQVAIQAKQTRAALTLLQFRQTDVLLKLPTSASYVEFCVKQSADPRVMRALLEADPKLIEKKHPLARAEKVPAPIALAIAKNDFENLSVMLDFFELRGPFGFELAFDSGSSEIMSVLAQKTLPGEEGNSASYQGDWKWLMERSVKEDKLDRLPFLYRASSLALFHFIENLDCISLQKMVRSIDRSEFMNSPGVFKNSIYVYSPRNSERNLVTPLFHFIYEASYLKNKKATECVNVLLQAGASVNALSDFGSSTLVVDRSSGAALDARFSRLSPLHLALSMADADLVLQLLEAGADANLTSWTARFYSTDPRISPFNSKASPLLIAASVRNRSKQSEKMVDALLARGAQAYTEDSKYWLYGPLAASRIVGNELVFHKIFAAIDSELERNNAINDLPYMNGEYVRKLMTFGSPNCLDETSISYQYFDRNHYFGASYDTSFFRDLVEWDRNNILSCKKHSGEHLFELIRYPLNDDTRSTTEFLLANGVSLDKAIPAYGDVITFARYLEGHLRIQPWTTYLEGLKKQ